MAIVPLNNLGQTGLITGVTPVEIAENAFDSCLNVSFRNGNVEPSSGYAALVFASTNPNGISSMRSANLLRPLTFTCTTTRIYYFSVGAPSTDITRETASVKVPYTGAAYNKWTNFSFNGFAYFNNGIDVPQVFTDLPATFVISLTGWNSTWRALSIRPYKNALIAMNMTEGGVNYPHLLRFSDVAAPGAQPGSWTALPTNKAGSVPVAETQGWLIDGLQLADSFIYYKQDSYYRMTFIGGNDVYRFQKIGDCPGLLAPNCVVNYPSGHFCLGASSDVYVHNGGEWRSIVSGRIKDDIKAALAINISAAFVAVDIDRKECMVCYSASGIYCNMAYVWNWESDTWALRQLPAESAAAANMQLNGGTYGVGLRYYLVFAAAAAVEAVDDIVTYNGAAITSTITRTGLHFGDQLNVKTARAFVPNIVGTLGETFSIELGTQNKLDQAVIWSTPYTYTLGTSVQASIMKTGRYHAYRITHTGSTPWKLRSAQYDIEIRGRY